MAHLIETKDNIMKRKSRSDWEKIDKAILKAIREIEHDNPFSPVTIPQIQQKLKTNRTLKKAPSRRTIYYHLDGLKSPLVKTPKRGLIDQGLVIKPNRGQYSSKRAIIAKEMAQRFVVAEVYDELPQIYESKKFYELLEAKSPELHELREKRRDFRKKPWWAFWILREWGRVQKMEERLRTNIEKKLHKEIDFIKKNSEISILSKNKFNTHQKRTVDQHTTELIWEILDKRFEDSYEDVSFNLIISYNPVNKETKQKTDESQDLSQIEDVPVSADTLREFHRWCKNYNDEQIKIEQRKKDELSKI